jgi:hypothetical protein
LADVKRVSIRRPCAFTVKLGIRTGGEKTGVVRAFLATQRLIIMIIGLRAKSPFTSGKINWVRFAGRRNQFKGVTLLGRQIIPFPKTTLFARI